MENLTKIIYFVHGTTTDNADKLCSGWKEVNLNELGTQQAKNLGNVIREKKIKFVGAGFHTRPCLRRRIAQGCDPYNFL